MSDPTNPPDSADDVSEAATGDADTESIRARLKEPSQEELDALPADRRLELLGLERDRQDIKRDRRRQSRHQWFNSVGILFGVLFTAGGLVATTVTLRTGQEELRTAREGQVTDRYTKAVEQLGSDKRAVRTAAVYALERIAADSARDRIPIQDVLAAFVRENDPAPTVKNDKLPKEPDIDVQAALSVLGRRPTDPKLVRRLDLHAVRAPGSHLPIANLVNANLVEANLANAKLNGSDLTGANLFDVHLNGSDLASATLVRAHLAGTRLAGADLTGADLADATLHGTDLNGADLSGANLTGANLVGTNLLNAKLVGADLTGADVVDAKLFGAIWSDRTVWPESVGGIAGMRARSEQLPNGHYGVRP